MKPERMTSKPLLIKCIVLIIILHFMRIMTAAAGEERLVVFAAASTTNVMTEIFRDFQDTWEGKAVVSFAASSTLARQIRNGAPAAIYVSANTKWVEYLLEQGLVKPHNRKVLFSNRLVMIVPKGRARRVWWSDQQLLDYLGDGYLALANPDHTPIGMYARQSLEYLGLWQAVRSRIATTKDVRAALMLVERMETPLGIVYMTDARTSKRIAVVTTLPTESHSPILYWCALIGDAPSSEAVRFYEYLGSKRAEGIIKHHGFITGGP